MGTGFRPGEGVSGMTDFLYEYAGDLSTGNAVADRLNATRLSMQPEYWALIDYLIEKGVLDEKEFAMFLGRHFKAQVTAAERVNQEMKSE